MSASLLNIAELDISDWGIEAVEDVNWGVAGEVGFGAALDEERKIGGAPGEIGVEGSNY